MIPFILKYWRFGVGGAVGALIMFGVMQIRVGLIDASYALKIENTRKAAIAQCEEDKKLTKDVSHEYQSQISDLNRRLADLKRVRYACLPVTDPSGGRDAAPRAGHAGGNAVDTGTLYDYAGRAEQYRLQLIACQTFITRTWEAKKSDR